MEEWFQRTVVDTGRLPLACFLLAIIVTFGIIRLSVRLIRAQVRWWPRNVSMGGQRIHHATFGVVFMLAGGIAGLAIPEGLPGWRALAAALFGAGAALVLDEFALIFHLRDVYWTHEGRLSVDAVFVAIAFTGLIVLGFQPTVVADLANPELEERTFPARFGLPTLNLALAVVTLLKGKIWTGLLGLFVPLLLIFGAVRLARPGSPWARWRYPPGSGRVRRAQWREARLRHPIMQGKVWFQELIAGRHDLHRHDERDRERVDR